MLPLFLDECCVCGSMEERVFTDSWTGKELCAACLGKIIDEVTNSPCSEGDNLIKLLFEHGLFDPEDADDGELVEGDDYLIYTPESYKEEEVS